MQPLIVSARLAPAEQTTLNALRTRFFPPDRNLLDAHLTVLHHVPGDCQRELEAVLIELCQTPAPPARLVRLKAWHTGFAVHVDCPDLVILHRRVTVHLAGKLSCQDTQKLWPHVTLQNKATRAQSAQDVQAARQLFVPATTHVVALDIWRYDDGPWTHLAAVPFASQV